MLLPLLQQLISIPSQNPMGRDVSGPEYLEGRLADFVEGFFRDLGVRCERTEIAPGRPNVVGYFESPGAQRTVMLDAHLDTVPVDGMTIPPYSPTIAEGKIYGRGSCDIKGGLAAMLTAFARLVKESPAGAANVVMTCACDEEHTQVGIEALCAAWTRGHANPFRRTPDVALIAEPTNLDAVVAHRGATRWRIITRGRACHSSEPRNGVNAIYRMGRVLAELEQFAEIVRGINPPHRLVGPATLSVGRITGGQSVNVVPDCCTIEIDRRVLPGEDPVAVIDQLGDWLRPRLDFEIEMEPAYIVSRALGDEDNGPLADELLSVVAEVAGPHQKIGVPYGTHASTIASFGVPSVVFGPGSILQAHTKDEWLAIDELELATEVYYRFCLR
ncbi:MAG: M20 family peptidase [Planctomycetota bacterium]|nr:MAG: M20 family peptidase [Planctomycetota bacterium]